MAVQWVVRQWFPVHVLVPAVFRQNRGFVHVRVAFWARKRSYDALDTPQYMSVHVFCFLGPIFLVRHQALQKADGAVSLNL